MFNFKKLLLKKKKSELYVRDSAFFNFIKQDLIDRIQIINKKYQEILIISFSAEDLLIEFFNKKYSNYQITITPPSTNQELTKNKFDLILFPMGLHWINDVQAFLKTICQSLKKDGLFICNFPGGGSLNKLRNKLIELEERSTKTHTIHISPFIQFEQTTPLLQQAGFIENIIDMETLNLEHDSPLELMYNLKNLGESNSLISGIAYSINKKMYRELVNFNYKSFTDQINLITIISSPTKNSLNLKKDFF